MMMKSARMIVAMLAMMATMISLSCTVIGVEAQVTAVDTIPEIPPFLAPEEPGNVVWFSGSPTGDVSSFTGIFWPRNQTKFGDNVALACTNDWSGRDVLVVGVQFAICWILDSTTFFRAIYLRDYSYSTAGQVPGTMFPQAYLTATTPGNTMFFRDDGSLIIMYKDQGYIAMMLFLATGLGHEIIGGLENAGTTPVDGNKTVAVLPNMNGGCPMDLQRFIILDGHAIRLVRTDDIDFPVVSLYSGSYTQSGVINGDLLTARFTLPSSCQWSKSTNQLYVVEPSTSTLRRIDMNHGQVYALSSTSSGYNDGPILSSRYRNPSYLAIDDDTQILYVSDTGNNVIRQINLNDGIVDLLAGDVDSQGQIDGVGWDAQLTAPGYISKAGDHLYVYQPLSYRMRRVALPIEFTKQYHLPGLYAGESANFTFAISRACYYDMTVSITTSGAMLVKGSHIAIYIILAGSTSVNYTLSHPAIVPYDGVTHYEWVNITVGGSCIDASQFSRITTQSLWEPVLPPSAYAYSEIGFALGYPGGSSYLSIPFYVHPMPTTVNGSFTIDFTANDPIYLPNVPMVEVTNDPALWDHFPSQALQVKMNDSFAHHWTPGHHTFSWTCSPSLQPDGTTEVTYASLPTTGFVLDVWRLYFTIAGPWTNGLTLRWGALTMSQAGFQGFPADDLTIQPYCNGCGTFNTLSYTRSSAAVTLAFTAAFGAAPGTYRVYFNYSGPGAISLGVNGWPYTFITIVEPTITLPAIITSRILPYNTTYSDLIWSYPLSSANGTATDPVILVIKCDCLNPNVQEWPIAWPYIASNGQSLQTAAVLGDYVMSFEILGPIVGRVVSPPSLLISMVAAVDITPAITAAIVGQPTVLSVTITPPLQPGDRDVTVTMIDPANVFSFPAPSVVFTSATGSSPLTITVIPIAGAAMNATYNLTTTVTSLNPMTSIPEPVTGMIAFPLTGIQVKVRTVATRVQITLQSGLAGMMNQNTQLRFMIDTAPTLGDIVITPSVITYPQQVYTTGTVYPILKDCTGSCWTDYIIYPIYGYFGAARVEATISGPDAQLYTFTPYDFYIYKGFVGVTYQPLVPEPRAPGTYYNYRSWIVNGVDTWPITITCYPSRTGMIDFSQGNSYPIYSNGNTAALRYDILPSSPPGVVTVDCNVTGADTANVTVYPSSFIVTVKQQTDMKQSAWPSLIVPGGIYQHTYYANTSFPVTSTSFLTVSASPSCGGSLNPYYAEFRNAAGTSSEGVENATQVWETPFYFSVGSTCTISYSISGDDDLYRDLPSDTITFGAGGWVYPPVTTAVIGEPITVTWGIGPYPSTTDDLYIEFSSNPSTLIIDPPSFTFNSSFTQVSVTITAPSGTSFGDYPVTIEQSRLGGTLAATYSIIPTFTLQLTKASLSLPTNYVPLIGGGSTYGPYTISLPAPLANGISVSLSSAGCTFTPPVLVFTPADTALAFTITTPTPFYTGLTQIDYFITGIDAADYNAPDSTFIQAYAQGVLNITGYPVSMNEGDSVKVKLIPSRFLTDLYDTIIITPSSPDNAFTFEPSPFVIRGGMSYRRMKIIATATVNGNYSIAWNISGTNGAEYALLSHQSPAIPIYARGRLQLQGYPPTSVPIMAGVTTLITASIINRVLNVGENITFTPSSDGFTFAPASLTFTRTKEMIPLVMTTRTNVATGALYPVAWTTTNSYPASLQSYWSPPATVTYETIGGGSVYLDFPWSTPILPSSAPVIGTIRISVAPPTDRLIVTITDGSSGTPVGLVFTPSAVTFFRNSGILSMNVSVTATTALSFTSTPVYVDVSGSDALSYPNSYTGSVLRAVNIPVLTSVRFNPTGTRLVATWDRATNTPGVAGISSVWPQTITNCSAIIVNAPSLGLGTSHIANGVCSWTSATTLEIVLGATATILVGNTVTLKSSIITAQGEEGSGNYWSGSMTTVMAPLSLTLPTVTLVTVNEVGVCSDLLLDGRQVTGLPRSVATYRWNITSSSTGVPAIRSLLLSSVGSTVAIPSAMLTPGDSYTFTVSITNFLGATSLVSTRVVKKLSYGIPILTVSGASSIARTSSIPLTLIPALSFPLAGCITLTGTWNYKWFIASIIGPLTITPLTPSITATSRNLVVAAKAMSAGFTYTFGVNATSVSDGTIVTSSYSTYIIPSSLIAVISAGNRLVSPSVALVIDGSSSNDPDAMGALSYVWSCTMPSTGIACSIGSTILTSSTITVASSNLLPLSTYQFTLTVTSTIDGRSSSTSVTIKTDAAAVSVTVPIINVGISPSSSVILYNGIFSSDATLRLIASVSVVQGSLTGLTLSYNWIEVNNMIDVSKRTSVVNSASLVLPSGVLSNGASYTLRCTVTATNSATGVAMAVSYGEYSLRTSLPPLSSSSNPITISPSTGGIALSTVFTVSLNGFSGELDPFAYSFKQVDTRTGSASILGDSVQVSSSSINVRLPAGDVTIIGYVTNQAGQRSYATANVTVLPDPSLISTSGGTTTNTPVVIDYVNNITSTLLTDQILTGDTSGVLTTIQILTGLLNNLNTTGANTNTTQQIRDQFLQIISDSITTGTPEQIATTLESVTQQQLVNTSISLTLDVAKQLLDRLRDIANGNGGTNHDDITNTTQTSIVSTISNVITSATECTAITRSSSLLTSSINIALSDTIEGESSSVITSSSGDVSVVGSRTSSRATSPTILTLGGNNVVISPEATSDDNDYTSDDTSIDESNPTDVHIITYQPSSTLLQCYNTTANQTSTSVNDTLLPIDVPISPIVSITIQKNGSEVSVSNLSQPILFGNTIPTPIDVINLFGSSDRCSQRQPTCSWFDHSTNTWSSEGCTTVTVAAANGGSGSTVQCSCNHLTEFAILARESANSCNGIVIYDDEKLVYGIFAIAYAVVAFVSLVQISRVVYYTRTKCKLDLLAAEHVCVFIIAIIRGFLLLIRGQFSWSGLDLTSMSMVELGLLTAVPYLFQFLAYTFLVATWASVYHFAMEKRGQSPFAKLKVPFIITNTIIGLTVFGLFGAIGGVDADMGKTLAMIGTIIMAVLTFIMVIAYLVYGRALINTLTKTGGGTASKSPVVRNLYYATGAFCICFLAEATIWVVSAVILDDLYEDAAGILGAYYGVNWLSLVIILGMFRQGVNKLSPSYNRSTAGSNAGSSRTLKSQTSKGQLSSRNLTSDDGNKKTNASNHARGASNGGIGVSDDTDFGIELATVTPTSAPSSPVAGSGRGMVQHNRQLSKHNDLNGDSDAEFVSNV